MIFSIVSVVPWPLKGSGTLELAMLYGYNLCVSTRARTHEWTLMHVTRLIYDHLPSENGVFYFYMYLYPFKTFKTQQMNWQHYQAHILLILFASFFIYNYRSVCVPGSKEGICELSLSLTLPCFSCLWYKWFLKMIRIISLAQQAFRIICDCVKIVSLWIMLNPYFVCLFSQWLHWRWVRIRKRDVS